MKQHLIFCNSLKHLLILLPGLWLWIAQSAGAQSKCVVGQVVESRSTVPLPFAHLIVNDTIHLLADIDGHFNLCFPFHIQTLAVSSPLYRTEKISIPSNTLYVSLERVKEFFYEEKSDNKSLGIMQQVFSYKKIYDLYNVKGYSYQVYNKHYMDATDPGKTNKFLAKGLLAKTLGMKPMYADQHLMLAESVTEKKYLDRLHFKETVSSVVSSGITVPSLFIRTSQYNNFSLYNSIIEVPGKFLESPLDLAMSGKYIYTQEGIFKIGSDSIGLIKVNPAPKTSFEGLKGWLYINLTTHAVMHYAMSPTQGNKDDAYYGSDTLIGGRAMAPYRKKIIGLIRKGFDVNYVTISDSYFQIIDLETTIIRKSSFDEAIWEYTHLSERSNYILWESKRPVALTKKDTLTYTYFDNWKQKKVFHRMLSLGETFSLGFIPIGRINLNTRKIFNLNDVEGIRLGLGAQSNEKFSESKQIGVYAGYGFKDDRWKYGAFYNYRIIQKTSLWHSVSFNHDLFEAAAPAFYVDRVQYASEVIRNFRLQILDLVSQFESRLNAHPLKYLDVSLGYNYEHHKLNYSYSFDGNTGLNYNFAEIKAGLRFAYGQKEHRFLGYKKVLPTHYPVLYLQYTQGLNALGGSFNYQKVDAKAEFQFRIPRIGSTSLQAIAGIANGKVPYTKLYNMHGAYRSPSVVIRNSFETMQYNEFTSDRYVSFFIIHNLGRIYVNHPNIQPIFLLLHNFGFGSLKNPQLHQDLPMKVKTMEEGYIETGAFADNLLVFKIGGIKTGWGLGMFYRYGANASLKGSDNVVWKFSTNFFL